MTIDQALAKVSAQIDAILEQRLFDMALQMIADGADPHAPGAPPDPDASWQRVSVDDVLQRQRAIDAAWKVEAIAQIRKSLEAECCSGARRDADGR